MLLEKKSHEKPETAMHKCQGCGETYFDVHEAEPAEPQVSYEIIMIYNEDGAVLGTTKRANYDPVEFPTNIPGTSKRLTCSRCGMFQPNAVATKLLEYMAANPKEF